MLPAKTDLAQCLLKEDVIVTLVSTTPKQQRERRPDRVVAAYCTDQLLPCRRQACSAWARSAKGKVTRGAYRVQSGDGGFVYSCIWMQALGKVQIEAKCEGL